MTESLLSADACHSIRGSTGLLDLSRQQRNMLLFRPMFQLERSKTLVQEADGTSLFDGVDTHYLALSALDHMMEATTISMGSTSSDVLQHVADTATHMRPGLTSTQAQKVATAVLDALDNKTNKHREFEAEYFDALPQACGCSGSVGAVPTGSSRCLSVYPTAEGTWCTSACWICRRKMPRS